MGKLATEATMANHAIIEQSEYNGIPTPIVVYMAANTTAWNE